MRGEHRPLRWSPAAGSSTARRQNRRPLRRAPPFRSRTPRRARARSRGTPAASEGSVTPAPGGERARRRADLVIGVGTRYSDFTTGSHPAFRDPTCGSSTSTSALRRRQAGRRADRRRCRGGSGRPAARAARAPFRRWFRGDVVAWQAAVAQAYRGNGVSGDRPTQAEVIGVVNEACGARAPCRHAIALPDTWNPESRCPTAGRRAVDRPGWLKRAR